MARRKTADEAIEAEIERLNKLPAVKLAQKEQRLLMARKKRLYDLRWLKKRGEALAAAGWTLDTIGLLYQDAPEDAGETEE
jgi:hypothetical protein